MTNSDPITEEVTCPQCQEDQMDTGFEQCDAICESCGLVIHDLESPSYVSDYEESEDQIEEFTIPWREYCSVTNGTEEQAAVAFDRIETIAADLGLEIDARLAAADLYVEAAIQKLTDGRSIEPVVGALVALACRQVAQARPLVEISATLDLDKAEIANLCRLFQVRLELDLNTPSPTDYLDYLCDSLGYSPKVENRARELLSDQIQPEDWVGKDPVSVAGAGLYLVTDGESSQHSIGVAAGVTGETIGKRVRELRGVVNDT